MVVVSEIQVAGRLLLGALLGGGIGLERQVHGRPAGFRTHLLVCVASVLLMTVSQSLGGGSGGDAAGSTPAAWPPAPSPASVFSAPGWSSSPA